MSNVDLDALGPADPGAVDGDDVNTGTSTDPSDGPWYVWTPIRVVSDDKKSRSVLKVGTQVSASDLGIDDEEFQEYIDSGAVRNVEYPISAEAAVSLPVATYYKVQAAKASGSFDDVEAGNV